MAEIVSVVRNQYALVNDFIEKSRAVELLSNINEKAKWRRKTITLFGKSVPSPRLSAWYGDADAVYRYSGTTNFPLPWFDKLLEIRDLVEEYSQHSFNSVLLNLYRDGNDSMGSHSDNEFELGVEPTIASVSLGATRRFILHPTRSNKQDSIKIDLHHGSLLVMSGKSQFSWKHSVPKTRRLVGPRINLTFRSMNAQSG